MELERRPIGEADPYQSPLIIVWSPDASENPFLAKWDDDFEKWQATRTENGFRDVSPYATFIAVPEVAGR